MVIYIGASLKKWSKEKSKKRNIESFFVSLLNESDPDLRNHLINALLNEIRYINFTTYTFAHLFIKLLQNCNNEPLEEHLLRNLLLRFMFKPYPSGLVWILKEIFKLEDYDLLNRNVVKNNSYFCQIMDEMYFFVQEGSIKNLENYI